MVQFGAVLTRPVATACYDYVDIPGESSLACHLFYLLVENHWQKPKEIHRMKGVYTKSNSGFTSYITFNTN